MREYETRGAEAVVRMKRAVLRILIYVCVAMIVGLVTVGADALLLMAGRNKTSSVPIFVLIGVVYTLDGLFGVCGSGLLLLKRSRTVLLLTLAAALFNVALNLVMIPWLGVVWRRVFHARKFHRTQHRALRDVSARTARASRRPRDAYGCRARRAVRVRRAQRAAGATGFAPRANTRDAAADARDVCITRACIGCTFARANFSSPPVIKLIAG